MKASSDPDPLVDELFGGATPARLRAATLRETLRHARRRRHGRIARKVSTIAAVLLLGILAWRWTVPVPVAVPAPAAETGIQWVESKPLERGQVIETKPQLFTEIVTTAHACVVVETSTGAPEINLLSDGELFALFPNKPVILVSLDSGEQQLVVY